MRRLGGAGIRRGVRAPTARRGVIVNIAALGTFTRASEGSYLTGAPGDSTFLAWASADVLRTEDRGDGAGGLVLLEGEVTNRVLDTEELTSVRWTLLNSPVLTADAQAAPDGAVDADRIAFASGGTAGQVRQTRAAGDFGSGVAATLSAYIRRGNGTDQIQFFHRNRDLTTYTGNVSPAAAWGRHSMAIPTTGTGANGPLTALIEVTDGADFDAWGLQIEERRAPSSYVRASGASAATRAADTLTIASGDLPASLWTDAYRFAQVSPIAGSADLVSGDERWLISIGGSSNGIRIRHTGTDVRVEALEGGTVRASSGALTYGRHALLGPVAWDPAAGVVSVGGVPGSTGTPWTWTAANVRVGGILSGAAEAFARLSPTLESV